MNIIIDQPKLVRVVKLYLTNFFGDLTQKTSQKYPDSDFYVNSDNQVLMKYDKKYDYVYIDYELIWLKLESYFKLNNGDIQLIIKDWLEEHYNLSGVTPEGMRISALSWLEEHYKLKNE